MKRWKIGVLVAAGALLIVLVWGLRPAPIKTPAFSPETTHLWTTPNPWPVEGARSLTISNSASGPTLHETELALILTPDFPDLTLGPWTRQGNQWTSVGKLGEQEATLKWTFAPGNPQAVFELDLPLVPRELLNSPFAGTLTLPRGDIRYLDSELNLVPFVGHGVPIENHTPGWISWNGPIDITISQWWADRAEISEFEQKQRITFLVWHPDVHPSVDSCPDADGTVHLKFRMMVTLGNAPKVHFGRYKHATSAALVPIFSQPEGDGAAVGPEDYVKRARTLSLGHSKTDEPRYGNGGLVGGNHGGTLIVPSKWASDPNLDQLANELRSTDVELAFEGNTRVARVTRPTEDCDGHWDSMAWLKGGMLFSGAYTNSLATPLAFGPAIVHPAILHPHQISSRDDLTSQALSRLYVERLVRNRGVLIFETPLMATRNPLVPAANQALLSPERNGEWTIAPELESAFAGLELLSEGHAFRMMSVSRWLEELSDHRRHEIWFGPDGSIQVLPPTQGLTLIAHQELSGTEGLTARAEEPSQTWFVVGENPILLRAASQLDAVNWTFTD